MLISPVAEEENGKREGRGDSAPMANNSHEYRTASELFELMASNHLYRAENGENETLTTRDLVLIYKNIDLGNKLMSDAIELKRKPPNQYVETIVYEDLDSDSELSEICSHEDIHNVMLINNEQIDLLTRSSSFETTICHKFGDIDLCTSDLSVEYDRNFLFTNQYIKNPKNINSQKFGNTILPVSLLDYICYKRLEDDYNFDMNNIIKYVKNTIDQLKRISNGDYLTEKVKEKWRQVENKAQIKQGEVIEAKVLADKTSIPLYVEQKVTGVSTKWDDLVHSSVDIRSLSKILEKKIIVEVPKSLCGSYKLFSKCCDDNLIIRCQKEETAVAPKETFSGSHVDVFVQLNRSNSGNVISNINTIMILKKPDNPTDLLPLLSYESSEKNTSSEEKVIEINMQDDNKVYANADNKKQNLKNITRTNTNSPSKNPCSHTDSLLNNPCASMTLLPFDTGNPAYNSLSLPTTMYSNYGDHFNIFGSGVKSSMNYLPTEEFQLQKVDMTALPEESTEGNSSAYNKKRSPTRNRIKSPYENKSHLAEEKKRKKLLEVRQKREKTKLALSVNGCRVKKLKYPIPPQTANSVTKLSISNKSFYNSIYGQSCNPELKASKIKSRKETNESIPEIQLDAERNSLSLPPDIQEMQSQKYINKSYYLDNAVTEMMYIDKQETEPEECCSETMSATTNDIMDLGLLSRLITPSVVALAVPELANDDKSPPRHKDKNIEEEKSNGEKKKILSPTLEDPDPPNNTPHSTEERTNEKELNVRDTKKTSTSTEFIKSIDKIYELIHKLGKAECNETKLFKSKFTAVAERVPYNDAAAETSTAQCSDSGTSVKHQLTSSNPSCVSFEKPGKIVRTLTTDSSNKKNASSTSSANVVPKVIISAKSQNLKVNGEKSKRDYRRNYSTNRQNTPQSTTENPLKAISQLLHDFDNVQKNRSKTERGVPRKPEIMFADLKPESRNVVKKTSKMDNHFEQRMEKQAKGLPRDRKVKSPVAQQQLVLADTRPGTRALKKKVVDIVDEIKEARGEAVRGPCKLNARLNSLAQPRKTYVQAQIEEFHARFGKSIITDRLQKMSGTLTGHSIDLPKTASSKLRRKKDSPERLTTSKSVSNAHPAVLDKFSKRSSNSNKPDIRVPIEQCFKQSGVFTRETSKKKMVPFPSGCSDFLPSVPNSNNSNRDLGKLRAPYIPNDLELGSAISSLEESSEIRSNIHQSINIIIPNVIVKSVDLNSNSSKEVEDKKDPDKKLKQKPADERKTCDQQDRPSKIKCEYMIGDTIPERIDTTQETEENPVPDSETTLCHRNISISTFQKRINPKRITLTPNESMQQVLLLQSGDSNSVILQSTLSQNIFKKNIEPELDYHPMLTNLDWKFSQFPVQMPIVGYSIPKYLKPRSAQNGNGNHNSDQNTSSINKTTQCFKGIHVDQSPNRTSHVDFKDFLTMSSLFKMSSTVIEEEPEETNVVVTEPLEKNQEIEISQKNDKGSSAVDISNLDNSGEQFVISTNVETVKAAVITDKECVDTPAQNACIHTLPEEGVKALPKDCVNTLPKKCVRNNVSSSSMDTTSLDLLVGLLNEIQKITSCQNQIANSDANDTDIQCENIQSILKNAATLENVEPESRNLISITSLDKLRQLESNASILSFYLSNQGDKDIVDNNFANINITPLYVDKEVSTVMPMTAFVNKCTSVPSHFFPLTMSHSTNVSNSFIGVLSEPSSHSILTLHEPPLRSNRSLTCLTNLFELKKNFREVKEDDQLPVALTRRHVELDRYTKVNNKKGKVTTLNKCKFTKKGLNQNYSVDPDFDPVMKMKRDILVTVYSVLVLTVFAALSFPDILYTA